MSKPSLHKRLRWFDFVALVAIAALLAGVAWLPAQDRQPDAQKSAEQPAAGESSDRLDAIEKTLQTLLKEVQELKAPAGEPRSTQTPSAPSTATTQVSAAAPPSFELDSQWLKSLNWRSIGPANMGGRITDIAVAGNDSSMWWIATASGGLLKTINNGTTFEHQFDHEATVSIGAVAVAPSDSNIVWVGTGEANPRNSVSYGDGVYKSTDSGK